MHSQLFNNATDNVVTATVTKIASVGRPLIHLDTMYLNDDLENETQVERVCAVYNNADDKGEVQIFPVKTATTSSFSFDKANISIKNVSGRIDKANFIGSFIYYQRGDAILYANLDDMSLTGYVYPNADELKLINDGILLFGTDAYTV